MQAKNAVTAILTLIIAASLFSSQIPTAYAWNPSTNDLPGTDTSSDTDVNRVNLRFDIYTSISQTYGLQAGEDGDSIAFLIKLSPSPSSNKFTVSGLQTGDQYEVEFTIGNVEFSIIFIATSARVSQGSCYLYYRVSGGSWSSAESFSVTSISSGTVYTSTSGNIGFCLTDSTKNSYGSVKFIIKKQRLYDLGARGSLVSGIYAIALANGNGQPGGGATTPNDRCPSSESVNWQLGGDIPDLPSGILLLSLPLLAIYAYLKRSGGKHGLKTRISGLREG